MTPRLFPVSFQTFFGDTDTVFTGRGRLGLGTNHLIIEGLPRQFIALRRTREELPYTHIDDMSHHGRKLELFVADDAGRVSRCLLVFRRRPEADTAAAFIRARMSGRHSLEASPEDTFTVAFQPWFGRRDSRFRGRGQASVIGDSLVIAGRTRGLLRRRERQRDVIPLHRIENVFGKGRGIRFDVTDDRGRRDRRYLRPRTQNDAHALLALLPKRRAAKQEHAHREQRALKAFLHDTRPAYVTGALIATFVAVHVVLGTIGASYVDLEPVLLLHHGGNFAPATASGEWWRLLSSVFLHGGLLHLLSNLLVLVLTGRMLEKLIGPLRFLLLFLVAGVAGALVSINWSQESVGVGASGAIFGIIGALATMLAANPRALPMKLAARQRDHMLIFGILLLFMGFKDPDVDNAAHVGGFLAGAALGPLLLSRTTQLGLAYALVAALMVSAGVRSIDVIDPYRDEMAFYQVVVDLNQISEEMPATGQQINAYVEQVARGELDEGVALHFIETRMIRPWRNLDDRIRSLDRLLPRSRRLRDQIKRISGQMRAYLDLQYETLRNRDEALLEQNSRRFEARVSSNNG